MNVKNNLMTVNVLPSPTYNWLKMNEAEVPMPVSPAEGNPVVTHPEKVKASAADYTEIQDIPGGMGYDMDRMMKDSGIKVLKLSVPAFAEIEKPVVLDFDYRDGENSLNVIEIEAGEGSRAGFVMNFRSAEAAAGFAAVQTKVRLSKGANISLVQLQLLGEGFRFLNDIGTSGADDSRFEQIELFLRGGEIYQGSRSDLNGFRAGLKTDIGYLLKKGERLDLNYIANHFGRKTTCEINADGVLRDTSSKLFRGTINLRKGAKDAVGNERENVILMDPTVRNRTIPVILCDEEDVEGNHGATIGRLDDSLLFYLQSRGMTREEIYEMMATARIDAVINGISDPETRASVHKEYHDSIHDREEE